jgi:uncharacterized lipoprotein YddW (UPF0748 family)
MHKKYFYSMPLLLLGIVMMGCSATRLSLKEEKMIPKREFRGAWIQTVYQSEYKNMTPAEMRDSFTRKLNYLKACGINALIFQVRPEADAFYKSKLEPWSRFYTGTQGLAPVGDFDLMKFLIDECHKRNIEFHAWLNPYRAGASGSTTFAPSHIMNKYPGRFIKYDNLIYFDPGQPQNRQFICNVVEDIVSRYDVDGIHLDDYFYPYPVPGVPFPDDKSFKRYGIEKGYTEATRGDWRRENVNMLIKELNETVHSIKPWVRFGVSPFGIYRNRKSATDDSGSFTNGMQCYDDLYADVLLWLKNGWIDYNMPQIYWEIGHTAADYSILVSWWSQHAEGRHLYIGQDVARTMKAGQLTEKMRYERELPNIDGNCFWPANELLWNNKGVADSLRRNYHRYPALVPAYTYLYNHKPKDVTNLQADKNSEGVWLHWNADINPVNLSSANYFVIYRFAGNERVNLNSAANIVGFTRGLSYLLPYDKKKGDFCYVVTAVDRFHNESKKGVRIKIKL